MDILPLVVADGEAAVLPQLRWRALGHPGLPAQPRARVGPIPRDADLDAAPVQEAATPRDIVRVRCSLAGRPRGRLMGGMPSTMRSNTALSWRIAPVSRSAIGLPRQSETPWRFVPGLPRSVRSGCRTPFLAGMLALSQSILSASTRRPRNFRAYVIDDRRTARCAAGTARS